MGSFFESEPDSLSVGNLSATQIELAKTFSEDTSFRIGAKLSKVKKSLSTRRKPLWRCERCERKFANKNQSHFCGRHDLEAHFVGKPVELRAIYEAVLRQIKQFGPVTVLPEKTRIAFQVRMSFAQLTPRKRWVDGHVVLARRLEHPRFRKIDTISRRNHVHHFRLVTMADVDSELKEFLQEAYAVGEQKHLARF